MADQDSTLTQEYLQSLFEYRDGNLYWKKTINSRAIKNSKAGYISKKGYCYITVNKKTFLAHRLIFTFFHGYIPNVIDHIDRNPLNNKIENLRDVTSQINSYNQKLNIKNKSGVSGVSFCKRRKLWVVRFNVNKKPMYFGRFKDLELAELVAIEAKDKFHRMLILKKV